MKRIERLFPVVFLLMLIGGFFSCNENEDIEVEKKPDTIQTEYGEVIISADYVPIDWNKSANQVLSIEVPNEKEAVVTMALEDKKLASEIQKGSIITVDVDTAIYLRKVTSATVDGTKVTCVTTQGTLEDVFGESEFELCMGEEPDCDLYVCEIDEECIFPDSIEEDDEEEDVFYSNSDDEENEAIMNAPWYRKGTSVAITKSTVQKLERPKKKLPRFYPKEIGGYDENGVWKRVPLATTRDEKEARASFKLPDFEFDLHPKDDGTGFSGGVKGSLGFETELGFRMTTNYPDGEFSSTAKKGKVVIEPKFFFKPTFSYLLQFYFSYTKSSKESIKPSFKPHLIKELPAKRVFFAIGPVPVEVSANCGIYAQPEVEFNAEVNITLGGQLTTQSDVELGLRFNQAAREGHKFTKVYNKPEWENHWQQPTFALSGTLKGQVNIYPKFSVELYDIIGPYVYLKPYIGASASAGVNTSTGDTYQLNAFAGTKFGLGISADVLGYEIFNFEFLDMKLGKEYSLASIPDGIESNSGDKIKMGQMNDIEVFVNNSIFGHDVLNTWFPCNVLFYTEDDKKEIYDEYSSSSSELHYRVISSVKNGSAKVKWNPTSPTSVLTAAIYEPNGKEKSFVLFRPDNSPEGAKGIDMGTGLLWANMNIGAQGQDDIGDLVGWGDASGKHEQQSFDASYGNYVEDIEECMKYYGGTSPHSNIAGTKYDYASRKWGGQWRMPTWKEWNKLIKACEISYEKKEFGEYYVFTGPTGNKLYFPAGGYALGGGENEFWSGYDTVTGEYWTSMLNSKKKNEAWYVGMSRKNGKNKVAAGSVPRYYRQSVRAVRPK